MNDINTVRRFRHDLYDCFLKARDALFNTIDVLMTETSAKSFPELSQSLWFERKWSSLYEAFEDGRIDEKRMREVFAFYLPKAKAGNWLWLGIDASHITCPDAVTSADRSAQHVHNLPECKNPVALGWKFSMLMVLPQTPSSWTYILDQQRVSTQTTAIEVALTQLTHLCPHLATKTIVALDRGYDATWLWCQCSGLEIGILGRLKNNRCLYRTAPAPTGKKGAPRKDGDKLQPNDAATHGESDGTWKGTDSKGRPVEVTWWKQMHVKQARWLHLTVFQVVRPHATNKEWDPRVSWFVWIGDPEADLAQIALGYALSFDKQALLWEQPCLRTPEQFERWSHVVAMVHNHLVLARDGVEPKRRPWESTQCPPNRCGTGSTNYCHVWEPLPIPPNLAENRMAEVRGHKYARHHGFLSSARGQIALNGSCVTRQRVFC